MSNQTQSGVTFGQGALLLLLVTIIVVIVFPYFARQRCEPRLVNCQSNERQIGPAILQYCSDYDGHFSNGTQKSLVDGKPQSAGMGWAGQTFSYAKFTDLFSCPQDHTQPKAGHSNTISYGVNANIVRNHVQWDAFSSPNQTVMLFEVANAHANVKDGDEGASDGATQFSPVGDGTAAFLDDGSKPPRVLYATGGGGERPPLNGIWPPNRHLHDANYLLADGHMKWFKPDQVSTGTNAAHLKDAQTGFAFGHAAGTSNGAFAATFSTK